MANAVDRAPMGPARCALLLVLVRRRVCVLELELARMERGFYTTFRMCDWLELVGRQHRMILAAELLEAALRWHFESLHSAALEAWAPTPAL